MKKSPSGNKGIQVLTIAPHPDDESIGCGGTLCLHAGRGDSIAVVYLTSGELGLKHLPRNKAWLTREREAEKAARILGIARRFFLRLPDWFVGVNVARATKKLAPLLKRLQPEAHPRIATLQLFDHNQVRAFLTNLWNDADRADRWLSLLDEVKDLSGVLPPGFSQSHRAWNAFLKKTGGDAAKDARAARTPFATEAIRLRAGRDRTESVSRRIGGPVPLCRGISIGGFAH